jgi:hypothetical protein
MMIVSCIFFTFCILICEFAKGFRLNNPLITFRGRAQKLRVSRGGSLSNGARKKDFSLRDNNNQFDNHLSVTNIPDSLVKSIDGNDSMRKKFEQLCRRSQVSLLHASLFPTSISSFSLALLGFYLQSS